jgi:hypothetical protein
MNGLLANPVISGLLSGGPNAIRAAAEQQRLALAPRGGGGMSGAPGAIVTQDRSGADLGAGLAGLGEGLRAFGQMREKSQQEEARRSFVEGVVGIDPEAQKAALAANGGPTRAAAAAVNAAPNQRLTQLGVPENMQSYVRDLASRGMHNEAYEILSQFAKPRPAGDGFTLKPGEQRFDAQGRPIASGGEEPIDYNKLLIPDPNNPGRPMLNQAYLDARALIAGAGAPRSTSTR